MMTKATAPAIMLAPRDPWEKSIDPRWVSNRRRREIGTGPDQPPPAWHTWPRPARAMFGALGERVLEDWPGENVPRLAALVRGCVRAAWTGEDNTLDAAGRDYAARFVCTEEAERREWRAVEDLLAGSTLIVETLAKLRARRAAATEPAA